MLAFRTPDTAPRWRRLFLYSPVARIVIFVAVAAAVLWLMSLGVAAYGFDAKEATVLSRRLSFFSKQLVPFLGAYLFLVYVIERRRPVELAWSKVVPHGLVGLGAGVLFISLVVGVMWLAG